MKVFSVTQQCWNPLTVNLLTVLLMQISFETIEQPVCLPQDWFESCHAETYQSALNDVRVILETIGFLGINRWRSTDIVQTLSEENTRLALDTSEWIFGCWQCPELLRKNPPMDFQNFCGGILNSAPGVAAEESSTPSWTVRTEWIPGVRHHQTFWKSMLVLSFRASPRCNVVWRSYVLR